MDDDAIIWGTLYLAGMIGWIVWLLRHDDGGE